MRRDEEYDALDAKIQRLETERTYYQVASEMAAKERDVALLQVNAFIDNTREILAILETVPWDSKTRTIAISVSSMLQRGLKNAGIVCPDPGHFNSDVPCPTCTIRRNDLSTHPELLKTRPLTCGECRAEIRTDICPACAAKAVMRECRGEGVEKRFCRCPGTACYSDGKCHDCNLPTEDEGA